MIVKKTKEEKIVKTIPQIQRTIVSDDERVEIDWESIFGQQMQNFILVNGSTY